MSVFDAQLVSLQSHELNEQEIKKINPMLAAPLEANRVAKRAEQLVDLFETSHDLLEWAADGNAQICPHCTTLVSKEGGCNHITCKCGGHFCYGCGMKMGECTCATGHVSDRLHGRRVGTLRFEIIKGIIEKRRQRQMAFLMGSRCEESVVSMLPPDVLRRIAEAIK